MGGGDYLSQKEFNNFVDIAQIQHIEPIYENNQLENIIEFATESPWVLVIFIIGLISCGVVAVRVFKHNPWVNEFIRMWRTR